MPQKKKPLANRI